MKEVYFDDEIRESSPDPFSLFPLFPYDESGSLFASWYLLTNVGDEVADDRISLWYYWRWNIETSFKLLKKAGQQLESWEQESAIAIIKRLQVSNKTCSLAWILMRKNSPETLEVKELLVRFSGRQMKRNGPITAPALMDGICMLISCIQILKKHAIEELNHIASIALSGFDLGKEIKPWNTCVDTYVLGVCGTYDHRLRKIGYSCFFTCVLVK